jgi:hypothetical protein
MGGVIETFHQKEDAKQKDNSTRPCPSVSADVRLDDLSATLRAVPWWYMRDIH